jgi:hypothetical protein
VNDEGTLKDFQQIYIIKDAVFKVACAWNSVKERTVSQAWRKLWPAIITAQSASEEEGFTGFNDCNKDTVCEMVSMFGKLNLSNLNVKKWKSGSMPMKGLQCHIPQLIETSLMLFWTQTETKILHNKSTDEEIATEKNSWAIAADA